MTLESGQEPDHAGPCSHKEPSDSSHRLPQAYTHIPHTYTRIVPKLIQNIREGNASFKNLALDPKLVLETLPITVF